MSDQLSNQGGELDVGVVRDQFEVTLEDGDLLDEVELTTSLIVRLADFDGHLSTDEVDRLLGLEPGAQDGV